MKPGYWWALVVLSVSAAGACGSKTRSSGEDAGASGAGTGGASAGTSGDAAGEQGVGGRDEPPPTIDGVPIGDCREPTSETRSAGCPEEPPMESEVCEAPDGLKQCPYTIEVSEGSASQRVFICHPEQLIWGSLQASCGMLCPELGPHVIELEQPCAERTMTTCRSANIIYAYETAQQWLDSAFEGAVARCVGGSTYGTQFWLELENGCPARFASAVALPQDVAECVSSTLNQTRWDCAVDLSCSRYLVPIPL